MNRYFSLPILLSGLLLPVFALAAPGDEWTTVRGDNTPGYRYQSMAVADSGRVIALSSFGALMISDNGGVDWTFDQIEIGGEPVRGAIDSLYNFNGTIYAVKREMVDAPGGFFNTVVQSTLLSSTDHGNTWTEQVFPITKVNWHGTDIYGVNILGLTEGPGGNLLAYGTMSGTNNGFVLWSLGGVVFQNFGGWQERHFGYGPVRKITDAGGRAVAASHNAILDSADGADWIGYALENGAYSLNGNPLSDDNRERLRIMDIEHVGGTYVAQAGTFVKLGPNVDSSAIDNLYTINSSEPFGPGRNWTAFSQSNFYGAYLKAGSDLLGIGAGGMYRSSNAGASFSQTNSVASIPWGCATSLSSSSFVAVESSASAWKSTNSGVSWSEVWSQPDEPNLILMGMFQGRLFGRNGDELWASDDNGDTWYLLSSTFDGYGIQLAEGQSGRLLSMSNENAVIYSDNNGSTWTTNTIVDSIQPGTSIELRGKILTGSSGRLFVASEGNSASNQGRVYVSDNNGGTWTAKIANLIFGEDPKDIAEANSGRILLATNGFASFDPLLRYSDDNGETWSQDDLQGTEGLDTVSGDPSTKVMDIRQIEVSPTGRILMLGDDEIITSDDEGSTWIVRKNLGANSPIYSALYDIYDLQYIEGRWVAIGNYRVNSKYYQFVLISDDDGATWRQRPFETYFNSSVVQSLSVGTGGRIVASGSNGSVFVSDSEQLLAPTTPMFSVREGTTGSIPVERPAFAGAVEASFQTVAGTALAGTDFVTTSGTLSWAAGDNTPKTVTLQTVDNSFRQGERLLDVQIYFEDSNGLVGQIDIPVEIEDDEGSGSPGVTFEGEDNLYTSENGHSAELLLSLGFPPNQNVTVTVDGEDPSEGTLSQKVFTFTPSNWTVQQTLLITGVEDNFPDGDHSYDLIFSISSTDPNYANLPASIVSVTNIGDEAYQVGGEFLADRPPTIVERTNQALIQSLNNKLKKFKKKFKKAKKKKQKAKAKKFKKQIKKIQKQLSAL